MNIYSRFCSNTFLAAVLMLSCIATVSSCQFLLRKHYHFDKIQIYEYRNPVDSVIQSGLENFSRPYSLIYRKDSYVDSSKDRSLFTARIWIFDSSLNRLDIDPDSQYCNVYNIKALLSNPERLNQLKQVSSGWPTKLSQVINVVETKDKHGLNTDSLSKASYVVLLDISTFAFKRQMKAIAPLHELLPENTYYLFLVKDIICGDKLKINDPNCARVVVPQ